MSTTEEVLADWYKRVAVTQRAHYLSADHFGRRKYWLGVPAATLSIVVGTSVFATVAKQPEIWVQIAVGLASVAAAVLAGLQTFLGYAERAEKHRLAGTKYGALGRELEQLRASGVYDGDQISEVRQRLDNLATESPNNPLSIYREAGATGLEPKEN
jgi:hypothetical protein